LLTLIACMISSHGIAQPVLHPKVVAAVSDWAQDALAPPVFCGTLVKIAYDPTKIADASPVYFDNATGEMVATCDNPMASRRKSPEQRVVCPPVQWTCAD
jgi:hypothetical protein